jgi:hypothetical protein
MYGLGDPLKSRRIHCGQMRHQSHLHAV